MQIEVNIDSFHFYFPSNAYLEYSQTQYYLWFEDKNTLLYTFPFI